MQISDVPPSSYRIPSRPLFLPRAYSPRVTMNSLPSHIGQCPHSYIDNLSNPILARPPAKPCSAPFADCLPQTPRAKVLMTCRPRRPKIRTE